MYFTDALQDGSPWFMLVVFLLFVALILNESGKGTDIAHHPLSTGSDMPEIPRETVVQDFMFGHEHHRGATRATTAAGRSR